MNNRSERQPVRTQQPGGGIGIRDHRGARVRMLPIHGAKTLALRGSGALSAPARRVNERVGWTVRLSAYEQLGWMIITGTGLAVVVLSAPLVSPLLRRSRIALPLIITGQLVAAGGFGLLVWRALVRSKQRRHATAIARAALEERLCPCCEYDLRGLEAEPDGCTPCPECGAAWRVPPARA